MRTLERLRNAKKEERLLVRQGYECLFDVASIEELCTAENLIGRTVACLRRYFSLRANNFDRYWPERGESKNSSLEYAKVVAAFMKLLATFISEGLDWDSVRDELTSIKSNVFNLRQGTATYDAVLFDPEHQHIPDAQPSETDDYNLLNANRNSPTSIQDI